MAQLTAEQLEKLKQLNELVKQYPQDRRDKFFTKAANNGLKTDDADIASVLNAVFILAVDEKRKLADYIEHYVIAIPNNKTPQEVCLDYLDYVLNEVGIPYSDQSVKTQNSTLALDCLHFMEEYHNALAEEKKRANDPDYAARKQQEELWEREKAQLRENVKKVDAFFDGINVDSLYEKDLPFKNDMKLLTSREPLQLSEEDLTKCEQVYDEIFGKEDIKDLIQVYKFYAFIPFETDTQKNRRVALCDIDGKQLSEEEKAKEIRKGKAEILRAMFDPARKLQYRTAQDKKDRELKYGDVAYHQNQVDNAHININAVKTPEWLNALTEEKRKYNESLKATVEQVLSNPAPEMFSYTYEGVNNDNKLIDINIITENDYETMKKAAETFDKMFKPLSDKQKEIGISKDLVWSFSYKGNPIEKHIAHEGNIMRGWEIEVMAKAIALNAMVHDGKNVKFKPYDYSGNLPGFAPVTRPKSEVTMELKVNEAFLNNLNPVNEEQRNIDNNNQPPLDNENIINDRPNPNENNNENLNENNNENLNENNNENLNENNNENLNENNNENLNEINTNENNNEIHIEEDYPEFVLPEDQNQPAVQYPDHSFDKPDMDRLKAKCKAGFEAQKTLIDKINYNIEMNRYGANASTVTTRLNKADAEGEDFYNSFTNQEKGQLVIKNTNNSRALSDNLNGIKTSVSDSVNSENKGSKEFYATLSLLGANNYIEIGKRREQLENSNLFLNDPDRKIKLDYICQNETGNSAVDFEKGVTELKSDAERKASPGNGFGAKTDDSPMFKDNSSLKKMRMKDFLSAAGATEEEKKRFFDLYNKKGSAFSEEENAYTALMRIYKAQREYINSKDKSEAAVERGMLLFAKKEFYRMNTGSAMTQAEGMLYETLSEEDKRLFEAGKRLAGQDSLKEQQTLSAEDKKELQKIAFAGKAGKINRGLTEGEKNVTNAKAFNLENDPRFKVLYEQPVKGRKANQYDIYIQLNTGMNVFRKEDSLPDVYAKVIAAMNLKEKKVGFNLRKIADEARNVKNSPAFSEMTNDMMAKALATPRTAALSRTQLLNGVVPKEQPVVEDIIIHTEPNIIPGNGPEQNIIPNIGEERKPEENIIPNNGPEENIIPNNGPEQNIIPNIEGERRPNPTVIVNNELEINTDLNNEHEINTDQNNTNLLSGEEPKEEKQVYDDDLALYTTMKTQHAELSAKAVGDYLVARKRLERDVYRATDQTRKEELQKQLDKLIQVNEPKQEALYATEALIIALDEFHQKHKENLRTDKNLKRMVQDILSGHNPKEFDKRVKTLTAGVKAVRKKLRLRDDVMIPEELKDYVKRPDALAGPRLAAAQSSLLDAGKADLFKAEFEAGAKQSAMAAFKKEIGMPGIPEEDNSRGHYFGEHKDWDKINRWLIASNMATRRTTTAANVFLLYLMGREKDAFTFEQAYHFAPREVTRKEDDPLYQQEKNEVDEHNRKYEAEVQNFYKFLQDYPLKHKVNFEQLDNNGEPRTTELTEAEKKTAVRKWNNLLTNAMKNLEEYTFPGIDYSNINQLYASLGEIQFLSSFVQDFSQEGGKILGSQPAILAQEPGGMEAASKNLSVLPKIQSFCSSYLKVLNPEVPGENVSFTKTIKNLAGDRAAFAYTANSQFSGKKIKDLAKGSLADMIETLALQVVGTNIRSTTIFVDEAKEYLTEGKNAEIFNQVIRDSFETIRVETFNDSQRTAARDALNHGIAPNLDAIKASLKSVYGENIPKTPREIVDSLNTPDGAATLSAIATFKDRLLTSGYQEDFTKAIPVANKMNLVKVDGRTPGEIWGQKYAGLDLDENTLERALWAEVINAVVYGNQRITFDRYYVDTDMTMKKVGEEPIVESPERITQTQNFLNAVHKVTLEADNLIKLAESVDRQQHNIYENRLDNMISKANKLKNASINDNFPTLEQAVSEYKDAVKQFYDMQRNIGKTSESAAHFDNLESRAYGALDTLMDECRKYSQGLILVPSEYEGNAGKRRGDFPRMAEYLTESMKIRQGKAFAFEPDNVPYENEWAWLNNALRAGDRISDEQLAQFDQASGIGDTNAILTAYESKAVEMLGNQDYKNAITANTLFSDRRGTLQSVFATWLISTYKVDIPTVAKVIEGEKAEGFNHELDALHAEFIQFITDHPQKVKPGDNRETQRKNIKIWVKMFADTADAIKNYTLPDIDFSDAQDIKKHVKELNLLRNLGVDGVQELGKCLTSGGIDRTNHVGEKTGDEQLDAVDAGTLRQTQDLYMGVQKTVTEALFQGYYEQNVSDMAGKIAKKAAHRYMAGKMFNPYRGKTFGDFYNEQGIKYQNTDSVFQTLDLQIMDEDPNTNEVEKRGLTCNKAFGYLIGKNKKAYEDAISPIIAEYDERTRTSQNIADRGWAVKLRQELLDEFIRTEFSALPKNATAEEMINFLDKDTGKEGEKVRDRVTQKLNRTLFSGNSNTLIDHLGEPRYDLFLINGRKPSEIFAEKYPDHIEIGNQQVDISEEIREKLIFAEVLKAMADPDAKIEVRNFTTTGLGTIKENKPSVLLLPRKEMDKVQLDYEAFRAERDNLISELKDIKKGLQKTMSNPEANFNGDNNKEGTPLYQEMTRQLQVSIDILEAESRNQSRGTKRAVKRALEEMERAAANYDRNRRGTFFEGGAYQDKGKKRLVYSDRLKQGWVKRYLQSRDYLKSDLIVSADKNNNKLSFVNNAESMADMADELNKLKTSYGLQGSAVHAKNEVVRNEIRAKWDEYSTKIADYKAGKTETKEETLAKAYLLGFFERRMEIIRPDVNPVEWQYDDIRTMEHYDERINELVKNPVFLELMRKSPDLCIDSWHKFEKQAQESKAHYEQKLNEALTEYTTYEKYIADLPNNAENAEKTLAGEIRALRTNPDADLVLGTYYDNLSTLVLYQLLSRDTDFANSMRQQIAADGDDGFVNMATKAAQYLERKHYLDERNVTSTLNKLQNGRLADEVYKDLQSRDKRERETESREWSRVQDERVDAFAFMANENAELTEAQWNLFAERMDLDFNKASYDKYIACSTRLQSEPLTVKENVFVEGENGAEGRMEERPIQGDAGDFESFNPQRPTSRQSGYIIWTMATKDLSFPEAYRLCSIMPPEAGEAELRNADQNRADFIKFLRENNVKANADNPEKATEIFRKWADVYSKATEKIKEYKFPKVDYRDPEKFKAAFPEIRSLMQVALDCDQDYDYLFNIKKPVNGLSVAAEAMGGKDNYVDKKNLWWGLVSLTAALHQGCPDSSAKSSYVGNDVGELVGFAKGIAASRAVYLKDLQRVAGKSVKEAVDFIGDEVFYRNFVAQKYKTDAKENAYNKESITAEATMKYLLGKDRDKYETALQPFIDGMKREAIEGNVDIQRQRAAKLLVHFTIDDNIREKLDNLQDNVEDIDAFMNSVVFEDASGSNNSLTGRAWLEKFFEQTLGQDEEMIARMNGIPTIDLILIDGRTPSEIYANKYADIDDSVKKEEMIRLEVAKALLNRENRIEKRIFTFKAGKLVETATSPIVLNPEDMQKTLNAVHAYEAGRDELLSILRDFRMRYRETQKNVDANFSAEAGSEGNTNYVAAMHKLQGMIDLLKSDDKTDVNPQVIYNDFDELLRLVNTHAAQGSDKRTRISKEFKQAIPVLKKGFEYLRNNLGSGVVLGEGQTFKDTPAYSIVKRAELIENKLGYEKLPDRIYKQQAAQRMIHAEADHILGMPLPAGPQTQEAYKSAQTYVTINLLSKTNSAKGTFEDFRRSMVCEKRLEELASNKAFTHFMKEEPWNALLFWEGKEKRCDSLKETCRDFLATVHLGKISSYLVSSVTGKEIKVNSALDTAITDGDEYDEKEAFYKECADEVREITKGVAGQRGKRKLYNILADYCLKETLAGDDAAANDLRMIVASRDDLRDLFVEKHEEILRNLGVFEEDDDLEFMLEALDDGSFLKRKVKPAFAKTLKTMKDSGELDRIIKDPNARKKNNENSIDLLDISVDISTSPNEKRRDSVFVLDDDEKKDNSILVDQEDNKSVSSEINPLDISYDSVYENEIMKHVGKNGIDPNYIPPKKQKNRNDEEDPKEEIKLDFDSDKASDNGSEGGFDDDFKDEKANDIFIREFDGKKISADNEYDQQAFEDNLAILKISDFVNVSIEDESKHKVKPRPSIRKNVPKNKKGTVKDEKGQGLSLMGKAYARMKVLINEESVYDKNHKLKTPSGKFAKSFEQARKNAAIEIENVGGSVMQSSTRNLGKTGRIAGIDEERMKKVIRAFILKDMNEHHATSWDDFETAKNRLFGDSDSRLAMFRMLKFYNGKEFKKILEVNTAQEALDLFNTGKQLKGETSVPETGTVDNSYYNKGEAEILEMEGKNITIKDNRINIVPDANEINIIPDNKINIIPDNKINIINKNDIKNDNRINLINNGENKINIEPPKDEKLTGQEKKAHDTYKSLISKLEKMESGYKTLEGAENEEKFKVITEAAIFQDVIKQNKELYQGLFANQTFKPIDYYESVKNNPKLKRAVQSLMQDVTESKDIAKLIIEGRFETHMKDNYGVEMFKEFRAKLMKKGAPENEAGGPKPGAGPKPGGPKPGAGPKPGGH